MSDSVRPQRRQPTRLPRPWDSPGKNTGVGCHFLPQCMKVKTESEVAQSCPTPRDPRDCSLPGSSVHGICQARVLEWVAIASMQFLVLYSRAVSLIRSTYSTSHLLLRSRFSCVRLCATPERAAHQAPLSQGFSRQEHWSRVPFPSPMHESEN